MKKLLISLMAVLLLGSIGIHTAAAQSANGTVTGKAIRWDGSPIAGATIRALSGWLETDQEIARTTTDGNGNYALTVPVGQAYWIHIDTFGSWWGYSYKPPLALQSGEVISQVYFALGPRSVQDVVLPTPVSNLAPAAPEPPPATAPVSDVKPALGVNEEPAPAPAAPVKKPVSNVKPALGINDMAPRALPRTGRESDETLLITLTAALALMVLGFGVRRVYQPNR